MSKPEIFLFNSLGRKLERFQIARPNSEVAMYTCGPTVYSRAHIGNMRAYIFADVVRRVFTAFGYSVCQVMNITDVGHLTSDADEGEDKLELGARREGLSAWDVAKKYENLFFEDCERFAILRPTIVCRATDHIAEQIAMIQRLESQGFTYQTNDGVYFDSIRFPKYGELAHLNLDGLRSGHRVEFGGKKSKTDFALWKFSRPAEHRAMEWPSPWGTGFPGWHIECSAMATHYLETPIDIHTGGTDHLPVHHTNEIAQSECANAIPRFVNYWLHCEFLVFSDAARMGKSLGNVVTVETLIEHGIDPLSFRYLALTAHYRSFLKYSTDALVSAARGLDNLKLLIAQRLSASPADHNADTVPPSSSHLVQFWKHLADDLNTSGALSCVWALLKDTTISAPQLTSELAEMDSILALQLLVPRAKEPSQRELSSEVQELIRLRRRAREERDFATADRLRAEIEALGYVVRDESAQSQAVPRSSSTASD